MFASRTVRLSIILWLAWAIGTPTGAVCRQALAAPPPQETETVGLFRAGAAAIDVTPTQPTSIIAGGFLEGRATRAHDRLFVRCLVLDDGKTKIALAIVDTCMMTRRLIDQAKRQASDKCGIAVDHMMVSATHTHSAPAAMSCLGTRQDEAYAAWLPGKIAEAIAAAEAKLEPARIGWAAIDDWEHTHNRRWIRRREDAVVDPFGAATGRAHMHPGYLSPQVVGPSGPVDPGLSVLSVQATDGRPLAVWANYSQHYFGAEAVSADYFGRFAQHMAAILHQPGAGNGPFVCAMSQGTSGDLMWMDYGAPAQPIGIDRYAEALANYAEQALGSVKHLDFVSLAIVEKKLRLQYRVPDQARLAWARPIVERIENDLPRNIPEVYAREALILHERQDTEILLQAIRIGDLTICALPNEVYALTGLKLKTSAPSAAHFNIELANGAEGYIPPPEQHALGGYTTWPARTAGLEVQAEAKIVATLLDALEELTGRQSRPLADEHGPYAMAILEAKPISYWRLNDADGAAARNAAPLGKPAALRPGFAWYLPGVGSGSGVGPAEALTRSAFSGGQINRAVHLAGGDLQTADAWLDGSYSIALWFWLGQRSGASDRNGSLMILPGGQSLIARQFSDHRVQLALGDVVANSRLRADDWHFVVLARDGEAVRVHLDGAAGPAITTTSTAAAKGACLQFGVGLQGKLDEIAVFDRALSPTEIAAFWKASGMAGQRAQEEAERLRIAAEFAQRVKPPQFPANYAALIADMHPIVIQKLDNAPQGMRVAGPVDFSPATFATFDTARLQGQADQLGGSYSVSVWFRCETPPDVQPVTAYFFSRGPDGDQQAPGDHLGIGGNYRREFIGRLLFFNGNQSDQAVAGPSVLAPGSWNHVVLIRDGGRVRAHLNGAEQPEIDAEIEATAVGNTQFYLGARSDQFAPLRGQLAYFALFDRALTPAEAKQLHTASGQPVGAPVATVQAHPEPTSQPLSPDASLRTLHVPRGFRVELVAAEPQVLDPVAFDWDAAGRLWVVEMADYPLGIDGAGQVGGRIRVLEDGDGDGRFESSRLFADGLSFPNGILTWRDGVLVTAAPDIVFLRDTDGDGRADEREVLFHGFNEGNQQLRVNGLRWGLDNWVYCANGGHHPNHGLGTKVHSTRNGQTYEIGSRDFRFQPDTGVLELESGPSQFGRNRDAWGHWFGVQNANPLWHYVIADRYLARNPYVPSPQPIRHIVGPGSPVVYPASPPEKRYHSFEQSGRFTSACGGMIYGDDWLFGQGETLDAFTCEPFHNLVQHNLLSDAGVSFVATRADGEEQLDFFASEDRWCRPVMVRSGPDGGLWIADMYRYMIEHPDWLPAEGKAELLPHYRLGDDRGRIYRVVPEQSGFRQPVRLDRLDTAGLVAAMDSPSDWQRDKVQQLLLWRGDAAAIALLEQLFQTAARPRTRVQALYTLQGCGALSRPLLMAALADPSPRVRENALRLAETRSDPDLLHAATALANDPDAKVRLQLALTCGQWRDDAAGKALAAIGAVDAEDPLMVAAIMSSALRHSRTFVPAILHADPRTVSAFRESLLRQSLGSGDADAIGLMFADALGSSEDANLEHLGDLMLALERSGSSLQQLASQDPHQSLQPWLKLADQLIRAASAIVADPGLPVPKRLAAATLLSRNERHRVAGVAALAQWLQPQVDSEIQTKVIATLAQSAAAEVPEVLAEAWPRLSPKLQAQAVDAWLSRTAWTEDLLHRLERREIPRGSLDLTQQARLKQHPSPRISERARSLLDVRSDATPKQIVKQYREALELEGNAGRGKLIYTQACAKCHRRGDQGQDIGPNLATVIHHAPEKLLINILDPNADIQPGYQAYICLLQSGEVLSGLLAGETANSLTIRQANGGVRIVARGEIEELRNLNTSLMPEGLEAAISRQDLADLIAYLREPLATAGTQREEP